MIFINDYTTNTYKQKILNTQHCIIANDSGLKSLVFSLNGADVAGIIKPGETLNLLDSQVEYIYIKSYELDNSVSFRIFGYGAGLI